MVSHVGDAMMHVIVYSVIPADTVMPSEARGVYSCIAEDSYQIRITVVYNTSSLLYNIIPRMNMIKSSKKRVL